MTAYIKTVEIYLPEKIESNKLNIEGIFISQDYMRVYNYGNIFSHILGYTNKPNQNEIDETMKKSKENLNTI